MELILIALKIGQFPVGSLKTTCQIPPVRRYLKALKFTWEQNGYRTNDSWTSH
jgi:hypothetical protein